MNLHFRRVFLSLLLLTLPIIAAGCAGASNQAGSSAPTSGDGSAVESPSGAGATLEEEIELAIAKFLENFIESAQGRDPEGEKVVTAWQFLPPSVQNKLSPAGAAPSPDKIVRYLELSDAPDSDFDVEVIEADFMTKTGSARITLNVSGEPVIRIFKLDRVSCEGIIGSADEFNQRIEECKRTNLEPWKITSVTASD